MTAEAILAFWFEQCRPWQWFRRRASFDELIRCRFGGLVDQALAGDLRSWADAPSGALALVLLLDQFTRQIWRGEAKAYSGDHQAQVLTHAALRQGWIHDEMERSRRQFWLMPLLHSEEAVVVEQVIPLLEQYVDDATADVARRNLVQLYQFGRYPRRNAALGLVSTSQEVAFLQNH